MCSSDLMSGLFQTGYSLGFFLGPVLYGAAGTGMMGPLTAAVIAIAAAGLSLTAKNSAASEADMEHEESVDWRVAWDARGLLSIALLTGVVETAMYTLLPIYGIGIGMALVGAVVGEMIGASRGLGWYVNHTSGVYDMTGSITALVTLMMLAMVFNGVLGLVERRVLRWRRTAETPSISS